VKFSELDPKERLECLKLRAEIRQIRRPIHTQPSFYTALAPVLIAVVGLIFSAASGWFDVQQQRLKNERASLELQNDSLQARRDVLSKANTALQDRIDSLGLFARLQQQQLASDRESIANLERQRGLTLTQRFLSTILQNYRDHRNPWPTSETVVGLISELSKHDSMTATRRSVLTDSLKGLSFTEGRGMLIYAVWRATLQRPWRDSLLSALCTDDRPYEVVNIFSYGDIDDSSLVLACRKAIDCLETRDDVFEDSWGISLLNTMDLSHGKSALRVMSPHDIMRGVVLARKTALHRGMSPEFRQQALRALRALAPPAYYSALAYMATDTLDHRIEPTIEDEMLSLKRYGASSYSECIAVGNELGVPWTSDRSAWNTWIAGHQRIFDHWTRGSVQDLEAQGTSLSRGGP
jgi:hypothetical protein